MVGYTVGNSNNRHSYYHYAFAGAASGFLTRAICQPLDVIKIRFQLQVEPIEKGSKYSSIFQATHRIIKEESVRTLWSGHIPAQYLSITYGLVQFSSFEFLTDLCNKSQNKLMSEYQNSINFTCGSVAATLATVVSFPFDTVRTRLIAEAKTERVYKGVTDTFVKMAETEGILSLYTGLFPTLAQIAPHAGVQFLVYKILTDNLFRKMNLFIPKDNLAKTVEQSILASLSAGSIAGLVAKVSIYPFDLAKKRMQVQGFQDHRKSFGRQFICKGFFDCISKTIEHEGFTGIFKGLSPSLFKAVTVSALHFAFYEEIIKLFSRASRK